MRGKPAVSLTLSKQAQAWCPYLPRLAETSLIVCEMIHMPRSWGQAQPSLYCQSRWPCFDSTCCVVPMVSRQVGSNQYKGNKNRRFPGIVVLCLAAGPRPPGLGCGQKAVDQCDWLDCKRIQKATVQALFILFVPLSHVCILRRGGAGRGGHLKTLAMSSLHFHRCGVQCSRLRGGMRIKIRILWLQPG